MILYGALMPPRRDLSMHRYIAVLCTVTMLVGCAPYATQYCRNGAEITEVEFWRVQADCERKVGGANYPLAHRQCLEDNGLDRAFNEPPGACVRTTKAPARN